MASAALKKELECSVCLTTYTDPVTLRCGHNFCRLCIDRVLDTQDGSGLYSCPECREEFQVRPALIRSITLSNIVENFITTQPEHGNTRIFCTYCIHSPVPAVRSCLMCEASLCDDHLRVHSKGPEHVLTDPSTSLENRKCPVHKKVLEYYCTEDKACICASCCLIGEHRGHKMEALDKASGEKKKTLRNVLKKLIKEREATEERVWSLEERWRKAQEKADEEAERVTALFIDLRRRLDDLEKRILSEISRQKEQRSLSLSDFIRKLEMEKAELSRKMRHMEELCNMTDPLTVLQDSDTGDLCDPEEGGGDEDTGGHYGDDEDTGGHDGGDEDTGGHYGDDEDMEEHDAGDHDVELISYISHTLSDIISDANIIFYVQDPADILLDVTTAANNILLSNDLKTTSRTLINQNRVDTAERFQEDQVMSSWRFTTGRHYWDVEISGSGLWRVGMCYPGICRRGRQSLIGNNSQSWGLCGGRQVYNNLCSVIHNSTAIPIPHQISSGRVRIYVDYEAGELSFYELCDPIRHLHTFTTTFTEPLHAVFGVFRGCIKLTVGSNSWGVK